MSAKSILEADGKAILNYHLTRAPVIKPTPLPPSATHNPPSKLASLHFAADEDIKGVLDQAEATYPWLLTPGSKFVAKPDQLIKRRGKSGLLALNKTWAEAREWIEARAGKEQRVETVDGVLRQFLVEPFVPHPQDTEYYININSVREVCLLSISTCTCTSVSFFGVFALRVVSALHVVSRRRAACDKRNHVHAMCGCISLGLQDERASGAGRWLKQRAHSLVLSRAGRTKGTIPDPLLQSTYSRAIRTSTFTCQTACATASRRRTCVVKFPRPGVAALVLGCPCHYCIPIHH